MKYVDEYRDIELVQKLTGLIEKAAVRQYTFMEVCGGHTAAIHRFGIPSLLSGKVRLVSGPGCPVCVTSTGFIDRAIAYSRIKNTIIATFGDLVRVPGTFSSLEKERAKGADIRVVLSSMEALGISCKEPGKKVIFPGIGFETTAPGTAAAVMQASAGNVNNFMVLCAHKVMPPAMKALIEGGTLIDGFLCPGHVAAVTGSALFDFIPENYGLGCVVSGFEPVDLLFSILMLIRQVNSGNPRVEIQYRRAVSRQGNPAAIQIMEEVFGSCDAEWRGLGIIRNGGMSLREKYRKHDAEEMIPVHPETPAIDTGCICGEILRGCREPRDCPLYAVRCTPENPVGACMVSGEGTCNSWYRYRSAV
jgi:hydrogenase expression/formation protein HypD